MAGTRGKAGAKPARKPLPAITLARFKEVGIELERLVDANTDVFIAAGNRFRARHYEAGGRPLNTGEIAQIAAGLGTTLAGAKEQIDTAALTAYDEPDPLQLLLAAGAGTASAWVNGLQRVVALLELDDNEFRTARENYTLGEAVTAAAVLLDDLEIAEAQERAQAAMEHLAARSGVDAGKAWGLLARSVWQALQQAATHLRTIPSTSSLICSPASTAGPETPSSTGSPGPS